MIKNFPDAERYIAASEALLAGWCGPVEIHATWHHGSPWVPAVSKNGDVDGGRGADARLDPMRPEVRDHCIRALALPGWMRDRPGGIPAWASAGFVACHAARAAAGLPIIVPEMEAIVERLTADLAKLAAPSSTIDSILLTWPEGLRVWRKL